MTELKKPNQGTIAGELLARLGRELAEPLQALISEIHALDERNAEDDGAAHLVELGYALQAILEPVTELAQLEAASLSASASEENRSNVDLGALLDASVATPELAASFTVAVRGELGESFADESRLERGLSLCLRLMGRMTKVKTRLQVHREVHQSSDRIVMALHAPEPQPVALVALRQAAELLGACVDVDGSSLLFELPVSAEPDRTAPTSAKPSRPVLAFRRAESSVSTEPDLSERASIVLVVDHEPAAQNYLGRVLELEGFDVVKSSSFEHAYEAAHAYRPDVIFLDRLQLAHEEGDWVRRFKDDPALARTPLVLVQSEESESLGLVGVTDVIRKPIDPDEVVRTVDRLTGAGSPPLLVVRGEPDAAKWERLLEGYAARVVTASSSSDAERTLDTVTPIALVVDVRDAGVIDGSLVMLEALRRHERTRDTPVVAIHGRLAKKTRRRLESLVDRRLTGSELSRRTLQAALRELTGADERSGLGVS